MRPAERRRPAAAGEEAADHRLTDTFEPDGRGEGGAGQELTEPFEAGVGASPPGLHQAPGVQHEHISVGERHLAAREGGSAAAEGRPTGQIEQHGLPVRRRQHGQGMACDGSGASPREGIEDGIHARAPGRAAGEPFAPCVRTGLVHEPVDLVVQHGEQLLGSEVEIGERPQRDAQPPHGQRRLQALPGHTSHHQRHACAGERDHVEPGASQLGMAPGRQVARRRFHGTERR